MFVIVVIDITIQPGKSVKYFRLLTTKL